MSYTKNLGRVKGKKGNYFIPTVSIDKDNGKLSFHWEETIVANEESQSNNSVTTSVEMPIFIPNYDSDTGELSFTPTVPFINTDGLVVDAGDATQFKWNIRGPKGDTGETKLNVEFIVDKTFNQIQDEIDFQWNEIETELGGISNPTQNVVQDIISQYLTYKTDTLYVLTSTNDQNEIHPIYIYYESDVAENELLPEVRELKKIQDISLDLDNYYTKTETYSQEEINDFIDIQNTYLEKIYELLDVPNDTYNINGQEISNDMLDALIESKMEDYIKLEDTSYEQHNGTIYFIPYSGD